jgi:predicted phage-related endonuclease
VEVVTPIVLAGVLPLPEAEVREITSRGEWLVWRRGDITASRIGALFDAHPYMTLDDLAADMRGQSIKGDTPAMRAGRLLETVFPEALKEERPEWNLTKAATYHRLPDLRLGCTPDFWIGGDGLLQAKTVNPHEWERWQGRPPLAYTLQTLTELLVTGRAWGVLGVIVRSSSLPLHLFDVPRHPAAEARILAAVADFWKRVDAGELPVAAPKDEIEALLDDGSHRDLSDDNYLPGALEMRETLISTRGEAEKAIKTIDYEIKNRVGTASTAWLPGWSITLRTQHRREHTVAAKDVRPLLVKRMRNDEDG